MENEEVVEIHPGIRTENAVNEAAAPQQPPEPEVEELHPGIRAELLGGGTVIEQVEAAGEAAEEASGKPARRKKSPV